MNYSPLRYPGGKSQLYPLVKQLINCCDNINTYVEPFAGGAGLALSLLFNGQVDSIVLNDYDKAVYSFWRAVLTNTDELIAKIDNTPISIEEWYKQQRIFNSSNKYSVDYAFSFFYLNRTNRSGIIKAGPIGGYSQSGNWKIDARYNKVDLIRRINDIASRKDCIKIYNKDVRSFINNYLPKIDNRMLIYFDPPYYGKGDRLYKNAFSDSDHREIAEIIKKLPYNWIVTYDNEAFIRDIYKDFNIFDIDLRYSVARKRMDSEIMILKPSLIDCLLI
jgi:DNA adenine methylase